MRALPLFATSSSFSHVKPPGLKLLGLSWPIPFLMLCAALALIPAQSEAASAYNAIELATLPEGSSRVVRGANDDGEIVGAGRLGSRLRGFLLSGGALQSIAEFPSSDYSAAFGINNLGETVGTANTATGTRAFRSLRRTGTVDLGTLSGDSSSAAMAINLSGQAVGYSSGPTGVRAVIWSRAGAIQALPALPGSASSRGLAINERGDVVGVSETASGPRAIRWAGGTAQDLGTLPGHKASEALGINSSGEIAGSSGDPNVERHAVLWSVGGAIQDIGALPGGTSSRALGINNRSEVVGSSQSSAGDRAFLWTQRDGIQDLNGLLTSRSGFVLTQAVSISAQGIIVAVGQDGGAQPAEDGHVHENHELPLRVFRLVPVP